MYVLITTDCSFTGCETKHLVKVNSTADLEQIVDGYVADDIQADGSYEILWLRMPLVMKMMDMNWRSLVSRMMKMKRMKKRINSSSFLLDVLRLNIQLTFLFIYCIM